MTSPLSSNQGKTTVTRDHFLSLFLRSERELYRYVGALVPNIVDAEDIVQQTAIALWNKFDHYDPDKPFTPWACRFALNITKQWISRRQRWQSLLGGHLAEELEEQRHSLRPELERQLTHLENCISKLPKNQRMLLEGYYFHHKSVEALAAASNRTVQASYKMLQRVRGALQICIEKSAEPEVIAP